MTAAEEDCAAKPCGESISIRPLPSVRMIRQPPTYVPSAIAKPRRHDHPERCGTAVGSVAAAIRARVMTPIVFCASLVPCARETIEAEADLAHRNP